MKLQRLSLAVAAALLLKTPGATAEPDYEALLSLRTSTGFNRALELAEGQLSVNPNDGRAWAVSALIYGNGVDFLGLHPAKAREGMDTGLETALRLDPEGSFTHAAYGLIRRTTDPENAERRLRQCMVQTPEFLECYNLYGDMLRKDGRSDEAAVVYGRAMERCPNDGELLVSYALLLQETNRVDEALKVLRELTAEQPEFPRGHWHLATMLYETGGDLSESRRAATRALELDPLIWNGELLLTLLDEADR